MLFNDKQALFRASRRNLAWAARVGGHQQGKSMHMQNVPRPPEPAPDQTPMPPPEPPVMPPDVQPPAPINDPGKEAPIGIPPVAPPTVPPGPPQPEIPATM